MPDALDRLKTALAERYTVHRELGRGGMATVYLATDLKHDRSVALKVLKPELAAVLGPERFLREVKIAAQLTHPHILPLYDSGNLTPVPPLRDAERGPGGEGVLYYVMPYVEGESLRDRLNREKQLPLDDALQISREVADALSYAHSHGVIHRDIKPENILLESGHAVVADFGIARAIDQAGGERLTETGVALGTPTYMSPEQAGGSRDLDGRSDLYSLGCVLYEMLAGQPPFTGPTMESVVRQHLAAEPPNITNIRPSVPGWVVAALQRSLAKTPADRFNPVAQFGEALAPRVSVAEGPLARPGPGSWRSLIVFGIAAAVVLLVAGWFGRSLLERESTAHPLIAVRPYTIVAAFDGTAEDEVRKAATNLLSTVLDQSGIVAVLPDDQLRRAYQLASKPDTLTLDLGLARELAVRGAIRTVMAGTVDRVGRAYHLAVRVLDADSGTVIASERGVAEDEDGVIPALDALARSLRRSLGEQPERVLASREAGDAITPSFEAFRWFRRASERTANYELVAARDAYGRALTVDPGFAQAWTALGITFFNLGFADSASWAIDQAVGHPERQTERGRLHALGMRAFLRHDPAAQLEFERRAVEEFGGNPNNLGNGLAALGRYAEAEVLMDEWDRIAPFGPTSTNNFVHAVWLAKVGRFDDAQSVAARLPDAIALRTLTWVTSEAGDWVAAESLATRGLALGTSNSGHRREFRTALAGAAAARGRIGVALSRLRENLAEYRPGLREADYNLLILAMAVPARLAIDPQDGMALAADTTPGGMTLAAIWAAALGDTVESKRLIAAVRARSPERRQGLDSALALAQEWVAASGGRWPEVRQRLGPLGAQGIFTGFRINPLIRWLVAEADEGMGQVDSAVATYERIAAWWKSSEGEALSRGLTEPFAHQRLVVLYSQMGRLDDARRHWKIFSETFTQPDPEVAHLVDEARAALEEAERKGG